MSLGTYNLKQMYNANNLLKMCSSGLLRTALRISVKFPMYEHFPILRMIDPRNEANQQIITQLNDSLSESSLENAKLIENYKAL